MSNMPKRPEEMSAWERWELASFDPAPPPAPEPEFVPPPPPPEPEIKLPTAEEIDQIYQQAQQEGRQAGYDAGFSEGQQVALAEAQKITALAARLDESLAAMDESVAADLLALSLEVARQVVRDTIRLQPESILTVVREALQQLPHQHTAIYLNPEDAALLRIHLGDQLSHAGHRIHDDSNLQRGDCLIEAGNTRIDASLSNRWRRVVAALGGTLELQQDAEDA